MQARAVAAARTHDRILRAVLDLHVERFHDQITLEDVARRSGVTVQTVLRLFGSRAGASRPPAASRRTPSLRSVTRRRSAPSQPPVTICSRR